MTDNTYANLILDGADILIGFKQVIKALPAGTIECVLLAEDTDAHIKTKTTALCREHNIKIVPYSSKADLGKKVNIKVSCAIAGIKKK